MGMNGADWGNSPEELLYLIFKKLRHAGDVIRFGAVSQSWNSILVSLEGRRRPSEQLLSPLLLLVLSSMSGFYRILGHSNKKFYELQFSERLMPKWRCCGPCNGWLVFQKCNFPLKTTFVNPVTRKRIQLPDFLFPVYISKVVASSSPPDPSCKVMAIFSYGVNIVKLAFCKPSDESWKIVTSLIQKPKPKPNPYKDVIHYKDKFYALDSSGVLYECEVNGNDNLFAKKIGEDILDRCSFDREYLLESCGDLLQVIGEKRVSGYRFFLLKMDFETREWRKLKSLGENALFLGKYRQSFTVSTRDFPEFKADCIYHLHDPNELYDPDLPRVANPDRIHIFSFLIVSALRTLIFQTGFM